MAGTPGTPWLELGRLEHSTCKTSVKILREIGELFFRPPSTIHHHSVRHNNLPKHSTCKTSQSFLFFSFLFFLLFSFLFYLFLSFFHQISHLNLIQVDFTSDSHIIFFCEEITCKFSQFNLQVIPIENIFCEEISFKFFPRSYYK